MEQHEDEEDQEEGEEGEEGEEDDAGAGAGAGAGHRAGTGPGQGQGRVRGRGSKAPRIEATASEPPRTDHSGERGALNAKPKEFEQDQDVGAVLLKDLESE